MATGNHCARRPECCLKTVFPSIAAAVRSCFTSGSCSIKEGLSQTIAAPHQARQGSPSDDHQECGTNQWIDHDFEYLVYEETTRSPFYCVGSSPFLAFADLWENGGPWDLVMV